MGHTLGGYLGDRLHRVWPYSGRIVVAVASKVVGTTIFGLFAPWNVDLRSISERSEMVSAPHSASWKLVVLYIGFHLTATWTQSCALRPMCGDLVKNSQDRAQILALWSLGRHESSSQGPIGAIYQRFRAMFIDLMARSAKDCLGGHHFFHLRSSTGWSSCRGLRLFSERACGRQAERDGTPTCCLLEASFYRF